MKLSLAREILTTFLVALAYFITGKLGLWLAIPPGFATAVWPASGIALACVMVLGSRVCLGIFLGSFCVNLLVSIEAANGFTLVTSLVPALIAVGAVVQALIGAWMLKKLLTPPFEFITPKEIFTFLLIGGPVSCLFAATNGPLVLASFGVAPWSAFLSIWLNWWVGDTIGVLVFAPSTMIILQHRTIPVRRQVLLVLPLLMAFFLVVSFFSHARYSQQQQQLSRFHSETTPIINAIENTLTNSAFLVESFQALYLSSDNVSRREFESFAKNLKIAKSGVQAILWIPMVSPELKPLFIEDAVSDGLTGFSFKQFEGSQLGPLDGRDVIYPVYYLYPYVENEQLLGLDLASNPVYKKVFKDTVLSRQPRASDSILVINGRAKKNATMYIAPVFSKGGDELIGYVAGVLAIDKLFNWALNPLHITDFAVNIFDTETTNEIYTNNIQPSSIEVNYDVILGQRQWQVQIAQSLDAHSQIRDWNTWMVLVGGLFFVSIFGGILFIVTGLSATVEKQVIEKTGELRIAKERAEMANRSKSDFITNMSHELRTPLNGVLGMLELTKTTYNEQKQRSYIEKAAQSANFLLRIIGNLLDYAKIESFQLTLEPQSADIAGLVNDAIDVVRFDAAEKQLDLELRLDPKIPTRAWIDPFRFEQIVINLLNNAIKFTHVGKIAVEARVVSAGDESVNLKLWITDTGIGISEKNRELLFDPFSQADSSRTRKFGGVGLGLSIAKKLVELMGGKLECVSQVNKGSTFSIELPVKIDKSKAMPEEDSLQPYEISGLRVLIVEDNLINREVIASLLENEGIEVVLAGNGQEAIDRVTLQSFDCVVMDIQMPVMDGLEATRRIRLDERYRNLPIFALSAHASPDDEKLSLSVGMNEHLTKPIVPEQLFAVISRYCSH